MRAKLFGLLAFGVAVALGSTEACAAGEAFEVCFVADGSVPAADQQAALVRPPILTTRDLIDVRAVHHRTWTLIGGSHIKSEVSLTITSFGAGQLEAATASAVGRRYAIVVNGKQLQVGIIMHPLSGTQLSIAGSLTEAQVDVLARQLQSTASLFCSTEYFHFERT